MLRSPLIVLLALVASGVLASNASADATCIAGFDVRVESGSLIQDGAGRATCAGTVAGEMVSTDASEAWLTGTVRPGTCAVALESGTLRLQPRRLMAFSGPLRMDITASWAALAAGPAIAGTAAVPDHTMAFLGESRFLPTGDGCSAGRLEFEVLLGQAQPAPRRADQPEPAPAAAPAAHAPAKKVTRRSCRKAKGKRKAAKRCRRARRA